LFIINGVSFIGLLWPLMAIDRTVLHPSPPAQRGGTPVRDAIRFIVRDRRLLVVFVVFALVGTFSFNYSVSLLKIADVRYGRNTFFGILLAATGVGSMIGSLFTGARERVTTYWFFGNGVLLGVSGLALAWAPNAWAAVVLAIPVGFGGAAFISSQNAIVQQEAPSDMRGRLLALGAVAFLGTTPIGAPITGWVADHVSAEWSLAYGSVIALVAVGFGSAARRRSVSSNVPSGDHVVTALVGDDPYGGGIVLQDGTGLGLQPD
jgi:predicted MFS family arabinose efflux permease